MPGVKLCFNEVLKEDGVIEKQNIIGGNPWITFTAGKQQPKKE
jgi:hypothetical protein